MSTFTIEGLKEDEILLRLFGSFTKEHAVSLKEAIRERLYYLPIKSVLLFVSFDEVQHFRVDARHIFLDIHRLLAIKSRSVVYISQKPSFRGFAIWILHSLQDQEGKVVTSLRDGYLWASQTSMESF